MLRCYFSAMTASLNYIQAITALLAGLAAHSLTAAEITPENWADYTVSWNTNGTRPASLASILEPVAGKDGFIRVQNGHLVRPDGRRFRIWGINATMQGALPAKEAAPVVAQRLAETGINCVRFHFIDRPAPAGLLDANRDDSQTFDENQLDRLDYFIAELKKRGIYSDLNLNVGRRYRAGDGVKEYELLGVGKGATYFDPRLIALQKDYARKLLTHRNPYTGSTYAAEPAVAIVEFLNENSLVEAWFSGRLLGEIKTKPRDVWSDVPSSYAEELTRQFNEWLRTRVSAETLARWRTEAGVAPDAPLPRLRPNQFKSASAERFQTEAAFYLDVEAKFFKEMARFLREDLKVRQVLVGNSDHGHYKSGYPIVAGTSLLDAVDGHVYWQHPRYINDPQTGQRRGFEISNTPMVDEPLRSTVVQLARSAVAGKPYIVSEYNHPFPNEYAAEGVPILAAYAALQDWDGLFAYTLAHGDIVQAPAKVGGHFDFAVEPVKMAQLAVGAMLFLRGDVKPSPTTHLRSYTRAQVLESIRMSSSEAPFFTPGFSLALPLQQAVRIASLDAQAGSVPTSPPAANPIESITGELKWHYTGKKSGLVTIQTPKTQAVIGFCGGKIQSLDNLEADVTPAFCAITLSALDGPNIAQARRLLLTASGRVANTGMQWDEKRKTLTNWGTAPTRIELVQGVVRLRQISNARSVIARPLDGAGQPTAAAIKAEKKGEVWELPLGSTPTVWFLIEVSR